MSNIRLSDLNEITHTQLTSNDLFLVSDVNAVESKKMQAAELQEYILGSNNGNTFNGTASLALTASTLGNRYVSIDENGNIFSNGPVHSTAPLQGMLIAEIGQAFVSTMLPIFGQSALVTVGSDLLQSSSVSLNSFGDMTGVRNITGKNFFGTASFVNSASYAGRTTTASFALLAATASFLLTASVKNAQTASVMTKVDSLGDAWFFDGINWLDITSFGTSPVMQLRGSTSASLILNGGLQVNVPTTNPTIPLVYITDQQANISSYNLIEVWSFGIFGNKLLAYLDRNGLFHTTASVAKLAYTASTANFLNYNGTPNGTAAVAISSSFASVAAVASTVSTTNIYRELDPLTSSLVSPSVAYFGFTQFTQSKVIAEVWGDITVPCTQSSAASGSLLLIFDNSGAGPAEFILDRASFQSYVTASVSAVSGAASVTGSIIMPFYLKGQFSATSIIGGERYSSSIQAFNGITIYTGSRFPHCTIKVNTDNFVHE